MNRNGFTTMRVVMELEATHGFGRETLIDLHTMVLSYNKIQVRIKSHSHEHETCDECSLSL